MGNGAQLLLYINFLIIKKIMNSIYIMSGRKVCEGTFLVLLSCIMIQPLSMGSPTILLHLLVIKICAYTTLSINLMLNSIEKVLHTLQIFLSDRDQLRSPLTFFF